MDQENRQDRQDRHGVERDGRVDVVDRLARIETKLDIALVTTLTDHEKRLRRVEHFQALWAGAGSALGMAIGWLAKGHL